MIEHLSTLIEYFPGAANQTRCFAHILNLVVKSVLCQFDTPKKRAADGDSRDLDDASNALAALAQELEDTETEADDGSEEGDDNGGEDDGDDGLVDERDGMSEAEVDELEASLVPVRMMLTKASRFEVERSPAYLVLIACHSFELSPTLSRIPPPSSSPNGLKCLGFSASAFG